jgi:hypothetical protein
MSIMAASDAHALATIIPDWVMSELGVETSPLPVVASMPRTLA